MQRFELEKLTRKELQALAKEHGVKANLSNNDIIAKLSELSVDTEEETKAVEIVSTELTSAEETPVIVEEASVSPEVEIVAEVPVVENIVLFNAEDVTVGDSVEVDVSGVWTKAMVKRVNKKTVRVSLMDTREELTVKFDEIRAVQADAAATVEDITTSVNTTEMVVQKEDMEIEEELVVSFVESKNDTELPQVEATEIVIVEPITETCSMEVEEAAVESQIEVIVAPTVVEEVVTPTEDVEVPLVQIESIPQAPPTPMAAPARSSSIGWSVLDSAVKCVNPSSNRRKERRNARRSAMKLLAESMKMESEQTLLSETEAEEKMELSQPTEQEQPAQKISEEVSVSEPVEAIQAPEVTQMPEAPVVMAPTPAAFVASTPAAPAPAPAATIAVHSASTTTTVANNKTDMLPRMNKAQAMRLGAIQKKIVTTDTLPVESVAFTNKAARPSLAPTTSLAMTPAVHKRNSISTSAPSTANQLHQPGAPFRKAATPLSGRASMLTSGTKRKMSDFGCNSANSTAPDFKRLHTKQFSALKSIAECVDQDKGVGVRMTIAMESAMTTSSSNNNNNNVKAKATPQAVPPAIAAKVPSASAVAKQNPFSKVVQSTPSKKAPVSSTPANVLTHASRPGSASVHTGKAHGHNGNSSNIVKSRTVTSFVTAAAPSSCGHNNLTSFVNNENTASQSVHNSGATSFLKNKGDSVGAGKHRTVMLSGASNIRQQHLTML